MTIHWLDFAIGVALGTIPGILATWKISPSVHRWSERRALYREYHALAGRYVDYRMAEDGSFEPTGETVELAWEPKQCVFEATAFAANGFTAWHSYITMNLRFKGTGTGHYNIVDSIHGGMQQVVYSRQVRAFTVMQTDNARKPFVHCWKVKQEGQ